MQQPEVGKKSGTSNIEYNIVSILYHSLQAVETCELYLKDAEASRDEELRNLLQQAQKVNADLAQRAKGLLFERAGSKSSGMSH